MIWPIGREGVSYRLIKSASRFHQASTASCAWHMSLRRRSPTDSAHGNHHCRSLVTALHPNHLIISSIYFTARSARLAMHNDRNATADFRLTDCHLRNCLIKFAARASRCTMTSNCRLPTYTSSSTQLSDQVNLRRVINMSLCTQTRILN